MKKILLALGIMIGSISSAFAACVSPAVMHDFPGTAFNMSLATAPDTNCQSNVAIPTWAGGTLGAMANYGTSPGAVLVPGVNSFITNTPAVSQSGTWIVQGTGASGAALSGNPFRVGLSDGTNSQNWLASIALADGVNGNNTGAVATWLWNGTTYDRQRGDLTNGAFVNVKTSVLPTGAATAVLQGTNTATTAHTCSVAGYSELGCLGQIDDDVKGPIPAGTNTVGNIGFDPSSGKGTPASVAINVSTATTTQLVALSGSTKIYITSFDVIAGGTGNITFEYGTGASCGTGTTALTGAYNLTAQAGIAKGAGTGPILIVPAGNALCVLTSAAVQMSGSVSYQQF